MSTELNLDLAALVGEMEAPSCESIGHEIQPLVHDHGPATHYARIRCDACRLDAVKAYCATFVSTVLAGPDHFECFVCGVLLAVDGHITILGPVSK